MMPKLRAPGAAQPRGYMPWLRSPGVTDEYHRRILATQPGALVACWPLWDNAGTQAIDISDRALHGTHTGVALGQPGIGDGRSSGLYDGATRYTNVYSSGLALNPANEMTQNASFETLGAGPPTFALWNDETTGTGSVAVEGAFVHSGVRAAKLTQGTGYGGLNQPYTVIPGSTLNLAIWTAGDGVNAGRYRVWDVTHASAIQATTSTGITAAEYNRITYQFTVPAGCTSVQVNVYSPSAAGGIAYFDDVSLKPATGSGFNGSEGTLMCWARVANAGVWTDGNLRVAAIMYADANNYATLYKTSTDNAYAFEYKAGGTLRTATAAASSTGWLVTAGTWSDAANRMDLWMSGSQAGGFVHTGVWVGGLSATRSVVGATSTAPSQVWNGYLAYATLWNAALTAAEIQSLARV